MKQLEQQLLSKYQPTGEERGGLIGPTGDLIELKNVAEKPDEGFMPDITLDVLDHLSTAIGTWHTHPGVTANLSAEDWETFVQWPDHLHAIAGTDGLRWYRVDRGAVINA